MQQEPSEQSPHQLAVEGGDRVAQVSNLDYKLAMDNPQRAYQQEVSNWPSHLKQGLQDSEGKD